MDNSLTRIQAEMEAFGVNTYYDNYFKDIEGMEGWKSLSFHKASKGGKEGCVVYIGNAHPYIEIEVKGEYSFSNPTHILIGTAVWYPKSQRIATVEETSKAISFLYKKIAERKAILERAKANPSMDNIKMKIYNRFNEINTNDKISVSRNLQFFHKDHGLIGYMVVEKNDYNEVKIKMVYPSSNTETFPVNYYEDGLTDHYYGKDKSWKDFFSYCL